MKKIKFIVYKSLYNDDIYFALDDPTTKTIDDVKYIEVTSDIDNAKRIQPKFIRLDSITKVGIREMEYV